MTSDRPIWLTSAWADDDLRVESMNGVETLGEAFAYTLKLTGNDQPIDPSIVLGQPACVHLKLANDSVRHFHGYVTQFSLVNVEVGAAHYHATLRPSLWFLTKTTNCRVFQDKTVPEVLSQILRDHGITDVKLSLQEDYRTWEYLVQYRESDYGFVNRLAEQEGIYYFFTHEKHRHTLVFADGINAHAASDDYADVPYYPESSNERRERDHLSIWHHNLAVVSGKYVSTDFDFKRPKANLSAAASNPAAHSQSEGEVFDYPGEYTQAQDGSLQVRIRLEQMQAQHASVQGEGNARGLRAGSLFKLTKHPHDGQNRQYLIVSTSYILNGNGPSGAQAIASEGLDVVTCHITAIDAKVPYRSPSVTSKPIVQGAQTAIVVGKNGEDIWTDQYGRVKVQFHWDRVGVRDENSSCWVRVAQIWAGSKWGGIHIPRIGQEVIVEFLEGDPDKPIITGRLYNADNMPPYDLPANQTQSGIKSRSTTGGGSSNFNELRFEDKLGEEQVYLQAEKNLVGYVKNDERHTVDHDRTKDVKNDETVTVGNNRTESVAKDESITIGANRTESVGGDESITISGNRTESIAKDESVTVSGARTLVVSKDDSTTVSGHQSVSVIGDQVVSVSKSQTVDITGARRLTVGEDESTAVTGAQTLQVGKDETVTIGGKRTQSVANEDVLDVGKKLTINAADEITLRSGEASITIKKDGTITINGTDITLAGSGKINITAVGDLVMEGTNVTQN